MKAAQMESTTYDGEEKPEAVVIPAIKRRRQPVAGWVYFMLGENTGQWKIGHAKDVYARLKMVQTGCSDRLSVYGMIPAVEPRKLERALHKRFARFRLHGEWFKDDDESILEFVDTYGYDADGKFRLWQMYYPREPGPRLPPAYRY